MFAVTRQSREGLKTLELGQRVFALATIAYMDYALKAPRLPQLSFLITVTINITIAQNATLIGFKRKILCLDEPISSFDYSRPLRDSVASLKPTPVQ